MVKLPDGRETTISVRHLAPVADSSIMDIDDDSYSPAEEDPIVEPPVLSPSPDTNRTSVYEEESPSLELRRSERVCRQPAYLSDYITN